MTIQWLGTPVRFGLGQVPEEIILSVQAALNRESDLRNSQRVFINSGVLNADMCQSLREWGGNSFDLELRTLVSSWGTRLQAACAEAGFGPVAQPTRPRPTGTTPSSEPQCGPGQQRVLNADTGRFECISSPAVAMGGGGGAALVAFIAAVLIGGYLVTQT